MSHIEYTHHADNWAKPLGDYLLLRQAQQLGQQSDQQSPQNPLSNEQVHRHSLLFQAFMGLLVSQLQEGHTCFELTDSEYATDLSLHLSSYSSWQNQLICAIATPLADFMLAQWQIAINAYGANSSDESTKTSQTAVSQKMWLSALINLIRDLDKNGLSPNQTSQTAHATDTTNKTNTKKKDHQRPSSRC